MWLSSRCGGFLKGSLILQRLRRGSLKGLLKELLELRIPGIFRGEGLVRGKVNIEYRV